jgi:hypothetical protein
MKGLAMLLDVLRPEDMPADDADSWRRLNRAISAGQSIFDIEIHKDSAAKAWLRECVFRTNKGTDRTRKVWLPDDEELGNIAQFKYSLNAALSREIPASDVTIDAAKQKALRKEVNQFLSRNANKGLVTIALRFEEHLDVIRRKPVQIARVMNADALWPLIPRDFVSADGARVVTPLTSRAQLTAHGESIVNCLAGRTRETYLRKGKHGRLFIVGILDATTRRPCSTAEISARFGSERLGYKLEVRQHTAKRNFRPSQQCSKALTEVLAYCRTPEVSNHLERGWKSIAARRELKARQIKEHLDALPLQALKQTISESEVSSLLQRVRTRLGIEADLENSH